jgi:hypothetical protein
MKNLLIIVGLLILLGIAFFFTQYSIGSNLSSFFSPEKTTKATLGGKPYTLILTTTDAQKEKGLSGRTSLPKDRGMLFTFEKADYYSFWMKDMKFPIDIIFLKESTIVTIHKNVKPSQDAQNLPLFRPEEPANQVIELNANQADTLGLKKGDKVQISLK